MFSESKSIHFVGICGTAMASTAAALKQRGFQVTGSDQNVYPPMSTFLVERQIQVMNGYSERNLAHKPDLVVIGAHGTTTNQFEVGTVTFCGMNTWRPTTAGRDKRVAFQLQSHRSVS